jgi:hypothetical protein
MITRINCAPLGSPRDFATTIAAMAPGTINSIYTEIGSQWELVCASGGPTE